MKYMKSISMMIVTALLFTSAVSIGQARTRLLSQINNEIHDMGVMKSIEYNNKEFFIIEVQGVDPFLRPIKGYYPINLDKFDEEFKQEGLEVEFTGKLHIISFISRDGISVFLQHGVLPIYLHTIKKVVDETELLFDISIENEFLIKDSIPVQATLKNNGEKSVKVCEMNLKVQTLDFLINTPDGEILHYIGDVERRIPDIIELGSNEEITYKVEDITFEGMFGPEKGVSYEFINGDYEIKGVYTSGNQNNDEHIDIINDKFTSKEYNFKIIKEQPDPERFELILSTDPLFEIPNTVFKLDPEPIDVNTPMDGKIHAVYEAETLVEVNVAESYKDYLFNHWSGNERESSENPLKAVVLMDADKTLTAHFSKQEVPDNIPPKAIFYFTPDDPIIHQAITFISKSFDEDGDIVSYQWDFGDGISSAGKEIVLHSYEEEGTYTVCLKVVDDKGASNVYCKEIIVEGIEPEEQGIIHGHVLTFEYVDIDFFGVSRTVPKPIPVEDALVVAISIHSDIDDIRYETKTDSDGYFKIKDVEPGLYEISAEKYGFDCKPQIIKVSPGEESEPIKILMIPNLL